jgi:hypothetical protein
VETLERIRAALCGTDGYAKDMMRYDEGRPHPTTASPRATTLRATPGRPADLVRRGAQE